MEFPLPGKTELVKLHRDIFFQLGPPSADLFADFAVQFQAVCDEAETWQVRAESLMETHQDYVNQDKQAAQNNLKDRYSQLRSRND
jgi:hypothetical protein